MLGPTSRHLVPQASRSAQSLAKRTFIASTPILSLANPLAGVPSSSGEASKPVTTVSTLFNGVKIASQTGNGLTVKVGVVVNAGSRFETVPGSAHVLDNLAFKSTKSRSELRFFRDLEEAGAVPSTTSGRETITYSLDALPEKAEDAIALLGETVTTPYIPHYEVSSIKAASVAADVEDFYASPQRIISEAIHAAAYRDNSPLGHSYYAFDGKAITSEILRDFHSKHFNTANLVITGVGIDHETLAAAAGKHFSSLPSGELVKPPVSSFKGGEVRIHSKSDRAYIAIALGVPGSDSKDALAALVLRQLLDQNRKIDAFDASYTGTGLVGVTAYAPSTDASGLASTLLGLIKAAASPSAKALSAAKAKAKINLAYAAESRSGAFEQLGRSVLARGSAPPTAQIISAIDAISAADITKLVEAGQGNLAYAAVGDIKTIPYLDEIKA